MKDAARIQAVITLLEVIADRPQAADRLFDQWARKSRFAGSKDRRFIGERFFTILRHRRRLQTAIGGDSARLLVLASAKLLDALTQDQIQALFDGSQHGPDVLTQEEIELVSQCRDLPIEDVAGAASVPAWAEAGMRAHLGDAYSATAFSLCERASLDLRVITRRASRRTVQNILSAEGIETQLLECPTALRVSAGRNVNISSAYREGLVEIQDLGAQMVSAFAAPYAGGRVLDYCAGAGGKSLAIADLASQNVDIRVYDRDQRRMRDLWKRAQRAGIEHILPLPSDAKPSSFDLVIVDVPCSGSGRWRRNPEQKWQCDADELNNLLKVQSEILHEAATYVRLGGHLAYMTCSLLHPENRGQIEAFCASDAAFALDDARELCVGPASHQCDGMYACVLPRLAT